jgi:hypothetical protein
MYTGLQPEKEEEGGSQADREGEEKDGNVG